jgi:crotonobetainyl-CoA:carnitine CoA-transferase CaiB-like acyl-CoA transferase
MTRGDTGPGGPLAGLVVVELARALAGPHAGQLLGDMGARVIKVEAPEGDDSRSWGPPFVGPADGAQAESTYFLSCNRNKESVVLDLKSSGGSRALRELVRRADVLIENFRPGVMDRLGFSDETLAELNPRLVTLSISGFGNDGPERDRAGYDQIVQGEAGLMSLTGPPVGDPTKVGVPIADLLAGLHGAYGVLSALYERERTGRGRVVRTSLLASVVGVHAFQGSMWTVAGVPPTRTGNHHSAISPYGLFEASDGIVQVAVGSDSLWQRFAGLFGLARLEWATNAQRVADRDAVTAAVNAALSSWTSADALSAMADLSIPSGLIRSIPQVYEWDQTRSQGLHLTVKHPTLGEITLPGNPIRLDGAPVTGGRDHHEPPPRLGEHTEAVLHWLEVPSSNESDPTLLTKEPR